MPIIISFRPLSITDRYGVLNAKRYIDKYRIYEGVSKSIRTESKTK